MWPEKKRQIVCLGEILQLHHNQKGTCKLALNLWRQMHASDQMALFVVSAGKSVSMPRADIGSLFYTTQTLYPDVLLNQAKPLADRFCALSAYFCVAFFFFFKRKVDQHISFAFAPQCLVFAWRTWKGGPAPKRQVSRTPAVWAVSEITDTDLAKRSLSRIVQTGSDLPICPRIDLPRWSFADRVA